MPDHCALPGGVFPVVGSLCRRLLLIAALVAGSAVPNARAQAPPDTLRLADALRAAREANPMLAGARWRAEAAAERVGPAGALPDLQVDLALMNRMVGDLGSTMDPMTMNQIQVTQMLPWPGMRGFSRARARHLAAAEALDAEEAQRMLLARVEMHYYRLAYIDRGIATMEVTRNLLREFHAVAQAMYGVGEGLQQDVLQAQVAVARMTEDIVVMQAERSAMAARLNALLGRGARSVVGALELPPIGPALPAADSLMRLAEARRPALEAARERERAADAGYRAARRELYPDLMLGVQYQQRPQYPDMGSLMVGVTLPVWAAARQLPMRREMRAMQAMADAEALDLSNETFAVLVELTADAERSRHLAELYATSILPQARAAVEGALAAYRVGGVDFMSVIDNQMTVNRYEIELVRLTAAYHAARAELEALTRAGEDGR
jgi:outer membrane protein TolC